MSSYIAFVVAVFTFGVPVFGHAQGELRLSCKIHAYLYDDLIGEYSPGEYGSTGERVSAESQMVYTKSNNGNEFNCTEGCDQPIWQSFHSELPAERLVLPGGPNYPLPKLTLIEEGVKTKVRADIEVQLKEKSGGVRKQIVPETLEMRERRQLIFHAKLSQQFHSDGDLSRQELIRLAKETGKMQLVSTSMSLELRCDELKPGQMSNVQIAKIMQTPPAEGFISYDEFDKDPKTNLIQSLDARFSDVLALAKKVDPNHRQVKIAEFQFMGDLVARYREILPLIIRAAKSNPEMKNNEALGRMAKALGIDASMNPTLIMASIVIPLLIAEEK